MLGDFTREDFKKFRADNMPYWLEFDEARKAYYVKQAHRNNFISQVAAHVTNLRKKKIEDRLLNLRRLRFEDVKSDFDSSIF